MDVPIAYWAEASKLWVDGFRPLERRWRRQGRGGCTSPACRRPPVEAHTGPQRCSISSTRHQRVASMSCPPTLPPLASPSCNRCPSAPFRVYRRICCHTVQVVCIPWRRQNPRKSGPNFHNGVHDSLSCSKCSDVLDTHMPCR